MAEISAGWRGSGIVMGDFNTIRLHSEAFGGASNVGDMEEIDMDIREADLVEPAVQRNWFTWTNKIHGLGLMRRLDRILVNDEGLSKWPNMRVNVLPWGISNHSPILVYPSNQRSQHVVSFRFFNHWVKESSFMDVVSSAWTKDTRVSPIVNIVRNLRNLKSILRNHFGKHIRTISEDVVLPRMPWTELRERWKRTFYRRSRYVPEIANQMVKARQSINALGSIIDPDGNRLTNHDQVSQALQVPIGREEVRRGLFSMDSGKAPGPDGYSIGFFKGAWTVTNYFPQAVNTIAITLIPKRNGADRLEDFRPISCCNVIYKCISRILADRLCEWLPSFVSGNQSAFIPGRSIIDNILLCQELVGGYHLHRGNPRCTIKVDLQKAYDSVNWDFLFGLLIAIGMAIRFVSWVRACGTSLMFSILINGSLEGFFHGRKGLRQGDPLSLFLFVMVMEVLSRMLNHPPQNFQFHQFCEKVKLTHLTFADDLMIFCAADNYSMSFIKETIKRFGELSGLFANLAKSSIFLVGVNSSKASRLAANMGFSIGHLPVRYLGLPLLFGRLQSCDCDPLIQRITSRIRSWSARVLSFAGRLQLVRSVLRSLQVYWASVFMLPMKVHRDVDKILRSYLWRGKEEGRGGAKVAWDEVCLPFDEGGLAIRDGSSWNIASTLKILWLLLVKSGSLWVAWVEAYILKGRSMLGWVDLGVLGLSCVSGISIKLILRWRWAMAGSLECGWIQGGTIIQQFGERVIYDAGSRRDARLVDFMVRDGDWRWPLVSLDLMDIWDWIQGVRPSSSVEDRWVWVPGSLDSFSIASAWETIRPHSSRVGWSGLLWDRGNIPKHSFYAWLAIRDRLGTRDRLSQWDRSIPLSCMLCGGNYESRDHLFFSCPFGWEIWSRILLFMSSSHRIGYWGVELSWICNQGIGKGVRRKLWHLLWCATIYFIWKERNHNLHGGAVREPMLFF
ncbi:uncharacterized protein LOC116402131 [Cucumis sativus]|uniref:uncharacterized protein LOC116402131 n=1 Tax=Cucumis sativus TaxID=3659 RepID=UPI0012F4ACE7|nr:uncharacterized protein LOC116402131 [Cucumis sativus]